MLRQKGLLAGLGGAVVLALAVGLIPAGAHNRATHDSNFRNVRVHGHNNAGTRKFSGEMDVKRFITRNGDIMAIARITDGVLKDDSGNVVRRLQNPQRVRFPVKLPTGGNASGTSTSAAAAARCPILNLVLGPLDLDLLGLEIHLNRVVLDIVAQSGPGKLLGNLLCAVAGLLDGTPALSNVLGVVRDLLNAILAATKL
jgi:hypothetical protein